MSQLESNQNNLHTPVLLQPIISLLDEYYVGKESGLKIFDGTLGGGGYSQQFLDKGYTVFAGDLDLEAINQFQSSHPETPNLHLKNSNFADYINDFEDGVFNAIVVDLGYSSNQLEYSNRGFSYQKDDEFLDLRYDDNSNLACYERLQKLGSPDQLWKILYTYSGESMSRPIAKAMMEYIKLNRSKPILVGKIKEIIVSSIPAKYLKNKNSILSRVWQALRIWTNSEFEVLEKFLLTAHQKLAINGLLCVVCFHSLEDKIVTKYMRTICQPEIIDSYGNKIHHYKLLTPKPILPSNEEIEANTRSRSAILRIVQRLV